MNYRQLQTALKSYRAQGYAVPKLNSKKSVLEAALKEIEATAPQSKESIEAEIEVLMAEIDELHAECDKHGIDVENLDKEEDRHAEFLADLAVQLIMQNPANCVPVQQRLAA